MRCFARVVVLRHVCIRRDLRSATVVVGVAASRSRPRRSTRNMPTPSSGSSTSSATASNGPASSPPGQDEDQQDYDLYVLYQQLMDTYKSAVLQSIELEDVLSLQQTLTLYDAQAANVRSY